MTGRPRRPTARLAVVAGDGQSVTVSAASSSDPDGAVVSYVWDLDGDGVYDTAGPAAQTVAVAGRGAQRLTVAAVDDDNLVSTATITVDEHSVPGQVGSSGPGGQPGAGGGAPAASSAPEIVVETIRTSSAPRLRLTVPRRVTLEQVRERGLRVMLAASRDVHVDVTVRRGTRVLTRRRFAATRRARYVTLRLPERQLRALARRRATTLTVETSAAGAATVRRRIVVLGAAIGRCWARFGATSHSGQPPWKGSPLGCRRPHGRTSPAGSRSPMDTTRRGNYDSGEDFVLEYGELRFTFNERDFAERCEQAALKLGFVSGRLDEPELEDLVNLAVNGEIHEPASALGEHVNDCWPELVGPSDRSLVHWLRRLVFRSAWLDQRVKEGELDVRFEPEAHAFRYIQPDRDGEPVELAPEPSWGRVAYQPR